MVYDSLHTNVSHQLKTRMRQYLVSLDRQLSDE